MCYVYIDMMTTNQVKLDLKQAMRNQKITMQEIAKEFGTTRQRISKLIDAYQQGDKLATCPEIRQRFEAILAQENINNLRESRISVEDKNRKEQQKCKNHIRIIIEQIKEILGDRCPDNIEDYIHDHFVEEYHNLSDWQTKDYDWKSEIIALSKAEDRNALLENLVLLEKDIIALESFKRDSNEIDEVEDYITIWNGTQDSDGRPKMYVDGYIRSFGMISGSSCQIVAEINDWIPLGKSAICVQAYIFVATDQGLWAVASSLCKQVFDTNHYSAKFNDLVPGYKYFYYVTYDRNIYLDSLSEEDISKLPEGILQDQIYATEYHGRTVGGITDYHPLKS